MQAAMSSIVDILSILVQLQSSAPRNDTLSVCELITTRTEHSGRMVTVRGEVRYGGHGSYLVADANCSYRLITDGVTWPNVIYMEYPLGPGSFRVDWKSQLNNDSVQRNYEDLIILLGHPEPAFRHSACVAMKRYFPQSVEANACETSAGH